MKIVIAISVIVLGFLAYYFSQSPDRAPDKAPEEKVVSVPKAPEKKDVVKKTLPTSKHIPDFGAIKDVKEKKRTFIEFMLVRIIEANKSISEQRNVVRGLHAQWQQNPALSPAKIAQVTTFAEKYGVSTTTTVAKMLDQLLVRVAEVPPSLAIAQAANESAWGTSRFARKGNNFYGQWCFVKGCGLVPKQRSKGDIQEVKKFSSPLGSVTSYMRNLNTHRSYALLRKIRYQSLVKGKKPLGVDLARGLIRYSERRQAYVDEIISMIKYNKLGRFDTQ